MATKSAYQSPITVVNTWPFTGPTDAAWEVLMGRCPNSGPFAKPTALNAVVAGCTVAEEDRAIKTVGYGCCPDEEGHTSLDAMVMDGRTMEVGAVAAMPDILQATQVAREVLYATKHTMLAGSKAADFARSRGFKSTSLDSPESVDFWKRWKENNCQPNFRKPADWIPNTSSGGSPCKVLHECPSSEAAKIEPSANQDNHDTIGMIALDASGSLAIAVSTSGLRHKIPGRVGDSPIPGAGGYVDNEIGAAVATGDGDILMRFLLTFQVVQHMRRGLTPVDACEESLRSVKHNGPWSGALVAMTPQGEYGAASTGFPDFKISVKSQTLGHTTQIIPIPSMNLLS